MGQKVHPNGFRLGYTKDWKSKWYADDKYSEYLIEDLNIREDIREKLSHVGDNDQDARVSKIVITRPSKEKVHFTIYVARPGVAIGKKGAHIKELREYLYNKLDKKVYIDVKEVQIPELDARLVADYIAGSIENRVYFRRVMKRALRNTMRYGADGMKIMVAGRLGGAEMSRTEWYSQGKVPLHTLKSDIDYAFSQAETVYGIIGVKVWICHGEADPIEQ
ncbi:MAG: 30S ribosomal protein S3 [Candidatus Mcinerneyibacterium aminivorans]|uniref:Small ribosomal subunit protein uS3 n=1 Tax=Candidatus Mcinerneyibacterium aminivorans TaxID=2703815 RepID=A0A5D0MEB6_9BACT|nr:MAG: 30S ribosomal protein S3 [Candidatus Mcinerneyibacterium aminivorans]